jgi:hypothetical protein
VAREPGWGELELVISLAGEWLLREHRGQFTLLCLIIVVNSVTNQTDTYAHLEPI